MRLYTLYTVLALAGIISSSSLALAQEATVVASSPTELTLDNLTGHWVGIQSEAIKGTPWPVEMIIVRKADGSFQAHATMHAPSGALTYDFVLSTTEDYIVLDDQKKNRKDICGVAETADDMICNYGFANNMWGTSVLHKVPETPL